MLRSLARELFSLRGKMTGDAHVDPALELGGQIKELDGHGKILCKPQLAIDWRARWNDASYRR